MKCRNAALTAMLSLSFSLSIFSQTALGQALTSPIAPTPAVSPAPTLNSLTAKASGPQVVLKARPRVRPKPKWKPPAARLSPGAAAAAAAATVPLAPAAGQNLSTEAATKVSDGDFLGAIQVWSRVIQLGPDRVQGYLQRAKLKRQIGDNKGAMTDLDTALQSNPNNVACLQERASLRKRLNDNRGALDDLNRVLDLQPQKADAYVDRGWVRMAMGDYVGSYNDYHTAVTINPALKSKVGGIGQPQISAKLDVDANGIATKMERGEKVSDRTADRTSEKSVDRSSDRSSDKSTEDYVKKPVRSQTQLARLNNSAVKEMNAGQFEEAIKTLRELMDAAPNYAHARDNLTIAHNNWGLELAKHNPTDAAKQFRNALYLDPSQGASRRNLDAMIRQIGKNPREANDRLTMAQETLAAGDARGAFVEATEAARLKNSAAVRATLSKALVALTREDEVEMRAEAKGESETKASLSTLKVEESEDDEARLIIIEQAKAMASAGQVNDAEELLIKLINHIKSKAAVAESGGFGMLDLALDTLSGMYFKSGAYAKAEANMSELVTLRENSRGAGDPSLAPTYRQYAKILRLLNRANEAATYEAKAETKPEVEAMDPKAAQR